MKPDLNDDFVDVLQALLSTGAEFVVVGAHALAALGIVRATGDIDILVRPSTDNAKRVYAALLAFGARLRAHGVAVDDFARTGSAYQLGLPPRRIDILTSISGVTFDEVWATRVPAALGSVAVSVMGADAMIRNKRAAGRPKDLVDADALEHLRARPVPTKS